MNTGLELPNPLTNGKIVEVNCDMQKYVQAGNGERGKPSFTMSSHQMPLFDSCPSRWRLGYDPSPEQSDSLKWGSLIDCLLLQPELFEMRYVIRPDTYPSKDGDKPWHNGANYCKEWNSKWSEQTTILSGEEQREAKSAVERLRSDEQIRTVLRHSQRQVFVTAEYRDEETGISVPVKGLIDLVPEQHVPFYGKCLVDLKTATSAHPRRWQRTVYEYNYHIQGALYLDAYRSATGEDRTDFLHLVQENFPPYEPGKRLLSAEFVELGRNQYVTALKKYAMCLKTGNWPGYDDGQRTIQGWTLTEPEAWMVA